MSKAIKAIYEAVKDIGNFIFTITDESYGFVSTLKADLIYYKYSELQLLLYDEYDDVNEPDTDNCGSLVLSVSYKDKYHTHWHPINIDVAITDLKDIANNRIDINELFPEIDK